MKRIKTKKKSLAKMSLLLILITSFILTVYFAPKAVEEKHQLADLLNMRIFYGVRAACSGTMTYTGCNVLPYMLCEDDMCCVWEGFCTKRLCGDLTDAACNYCTGCSTGAITTTTTSTTTTTTVPDTTPPTYSLNSTNSTKAGTPVSHNLKWTDNSGLSGYIFSFDNCTGASLFWWNFSWPYRKNITINNSANSNTLTNYPVFINITYDSDMQSDFDDLRFTYFNSTLQTETELKYWIEKNVVSSYAEIWVNVTTIPASGYATVYVYYGNPSVSSTSNATNTFFYFNDISYTAGQSVGGVYGVDPGDLNLGDNTFLWKRDISCGWSTTNGTHINATTNGACGGNTGVAGWKTGFNFTVNGYAFDTKFNFTRINYGYGELHLWTTWDDNEDLPSGGNNTFFTYNTNWAVLTTAYNSTTIFKYENYTLISSGSYSYSAANISIVSVATSTDSSARGYAFFDWVRARKFTYPEPTYSIGGENQFTGDGWTNNGGLFTGTQAWSNVTKVINSTVGCTIRWCVYTNDTSNNWNGSSCSNPFSYTTTYPRLLVTLSTPSSSTCTASIPCKWTQNNTYSVQASIECLNGPCGNVSGTVRYNASSTNPDTGINKTEGATPLFIEESWKGNSKSGISTTLYSNSDNKAYTKNDTSTDSFSQATTEVTDYARINVSDYTYETSYTDEFIGQTEDYTFQRFTFNLSSIDVNDIINLTYCHKGYYQTSGSPQVGYYDKDIKYYNVSDISWITDQSLSTADVVKCKNFNSGFNDLINSTSKLFQFGLRGRMNCNIEPTCSPAWRIDLYTNDVYLVVTTRNALVDCGNMNQGDSCQLNWIVNATGTIESAYKVGVLFNSSYTNVTQNHTNNATIKIVSYPNIRINGIALYYYTGQRVNGNVTVIPVESPIDKETSIVSNGEWSIDFNMDTENSQYFTVIIDDNQKIGYNEMKLNTPFTTSLNCSVQDISLSGYSVDLDTGNTITSGNVIVSILDTDYTNTSTFTGNWNINIHPCLIPGKTYTIQVLISDNTGKRGEYLQKYPARYV